MEEDQGPEQDFPVFADKSEETGPIHLALGAVNDVNDVGAIETLAAGDEDFGSDEFFGGQHASLSADDHSGAAAFNPGAIDANDGVAHAGDEIDEKAVAMSLGQPHRIADFTFEAALGKTIEGARDIVGGEKDVEIFGVPPDASVLLKREGAGDDVGDSAAVE